MRTFCLITLLTLAPALLATDRPESNVLGDECPELLLEEEMVQGEIAPLEDRVSFFLFYQRESEGCERIAMPRVQKLHEVYRGSGCWQVFVINTAFDKEIYPYLADIKETRKHLRRMEWTMPVARDFDELSNELFTLDDISGVPQAVVVDENGIVRAHDWYSTDEEMDRVDAVFKRLAAGMNCHCIRMPREVGEGCSRIYRNIEEGNYAKAWDDADTMYKNAGTTEADKRDAEYLKRFVEGIVEIRVERHRKDFEFDPETALTRKDTVLDDVKKFEGVPGTKDFVAEVSKWAHSPRLKDFREAREDLDAVEVEIEKGEIAKADTAKAEVAKADARDKLAAKLGAIAERAKDTVLEERVRKNLEAIGAADRADSKDSVDADSRSDKDADSRSGKDRVSGSSRGSDADARPTTGGRKDTGGSSVRPRRSGESVGSGGSSVKPSKSGDSRGSAARTSSESSRHRTVRSR